MDDRFIHGQVLLGWARELELRRIIIGCDRLVQEDRRKRMFEDMAAPGLAIDVFSVAGAHKAMQGEKSCERVMVLFGSLPDALRYYKLGRKVRKINVGFLCYAAGKTKATDAVFLDAEAKRALRQFAAFGVEIEAQGIPGDKRKDLLEFASAKDDDKRK